MPRIVSVWLPAWSMERLARARRKAGLPAAWIIQGIVNGEADDSLREIPFALIESSAHGLTLSAVNAPAWMEGLRPGLALADARAALPALGTAPAEPEHDRHALSKLAQWAGRYGPSRNVEGCDGLWIDTTGVAHLYGDEARMVDDFVARLARAGLTTRVGLADTLGAAFALARFATRRSAPTRIAPSVSTRDALAGLPVAALRLPADAVVLLRRLGLSRIGQLYRLPREALAQRFRSAPSVRSGTKSGTESGSSRRERQAALMAGAVLARLDQALGMAPEPRTPMAEPPCHLARRLFADPLVSSTGVAAAVEALAHELAHLLETRSEGGTRFCLDLYRVDGSVQQIRIGASRPCRAAGHLIALVSEKLDALDAGFGIDAMTLACLQAEPLDARQIGLDQIALVSSNGLDSGKMPPAGKRRAQRTISANDRDTETAALVDRLSNRLGASRVLRLAQADSHIPERAQRRVPMLAAPEAAATAVALFKSKRLRPALLLPTPEPITVLAEVPEGPPLRFSWRRLTHRIVRARGPERIEPEWWRAISRRAPRSGTPQMIHLARPRDYYAIEDDKGGRYWVFRAGLYGRDEDLDEPEENQGETPPPPQPVWFMHGVLG
jgi:protein ImuB